MNVWLQLIVFQPVGGHLRRSVGAAWQIGFGNSMLLHFDLMYPFNLPLHSWRYCCSISVPCQGWTRISYWLFCWPLLPLHVSPCQHYLLCYVHNGESPKEQGAKWAKWSWWRIYWWEGTYGRPSSWLPIYAVAVTVLDLNAMRYLKIHTTSFSLVNYV